MRMTGAQALMESLRREGVEVIFGYPGGVLLPIYDVLYDVKDIRHILVRHEQGAAHAADGYARASGKVGVCLATSGPGATNLVTGIATAYMDSVPIVAITGQVPTFAIGKDAFQEADITGITMPITKHNYLLTKAADVPRVLKEAFHVARTGRPGPVLVDFPRDVQQAELDFEYPEKVELRGYRPTRSGHVKMIERAAEMINGAQRPLIYGGGGINSADAQAELVELAERADMPVTMTLMGKGGFPEDHDLSLGMPGMHGTAYANYALHEADVILAAGTRFDDRVTGKLDMFARAAKFIHVDIDPAEIGKNVAPALPIVGDVKLVLHALLKKVVPARHPEWRAKIEEWKQQYPLRWKGDGLKPQYVIQEIYRATKGEAIIVTEVGQNQMWAAQWYPCKRAAAVHQLRGPGDHGLRPARGHRRPDRSPGAGGLGHRRRWQHSDEHPGDGDRGDQPDSSEDRSAEQRLSRYGAPVAVALLPGAPLAHRHRHRLPGLREAGRGLWRGRPEGDQGLGSGAGSRAGDGSERPALPGGFPGGA